jgi:hypothetical protein
LLFFSFLFLLTSVSCLDGLYLISFQVALPRRKKVMLVGMLVAMTTTAVVPMVQP